MPEPPQQVAESALRAAASTIVIIDDDDLLRGALRSVLEEYGWTVYEYATGEAFLRAYDSGLVARRPHRDISLLIDASLPGMGGLELLRKLKGAEGPLPPSIMITGNGDVTLAVQAMKAGASDFIEKPVGADALIASVERVLEQAKDANQTVVWRDTAASQLGTLTRRQRQIMDMVLAGHPSKTIAADLRISRRTVESHRAKIMKRTGTKSLPALVRLALTATDAPAIVQAEHTSAAVDAVLATPDLADALENEQFRRFLDQIPTAIIVSRVTSPERIVYANPEFEHLSGQTAAEV